MRSSAISFMVALVVVVSPAVAQSPRQDLNQPVQFNRDVRPILSDRCFLCHGPDQTSEQAQATDLRLDERQSAIDFEVFDFDQASDSELIARIGSRDPDYQMPPPDSNKQLLDDIEVETLKRWIEQGAEYEQHWAYIPPRSPNVPQVRAVEKALQGIDAFVVARLESEKLTPAPPADRQTLIRRVSFDLTGLPPTVAEVDAFVADPLPLDLAFEKVVDRLLSSPHYGEQMAKFWLDAARYADTSGYQYDRERTQWVWRDWVIHAFNSNLPFDQFTIHQLAGDLLPAATDQTRLATGFNRNHPITIEGGVVDEEYRNEYVIDRLVTTSTVWLGQTFLCARCHDHKYDPVSQENFYEFYSFFNNVPEKGLNGFDPQQKIDSPLNARVAELQDKLDRTNASLVSRELPFAQWEIDLRNMAADWRIPEPDSVTSTGGASSELLEDKSILFSGKNPATDDYQIVFQLDQATRAIRLEALVDPSLTNGSASRGSNGNFVLTEFVVESRPTEATEFAPVKIDHAEADYEQQNFTIDQALDGQLNQKGWAVDGNTKPANRVATFFLAEPIATGAIIRISMHHRYGKSHQIGRLRLSFSSQPLPSRVENVLQLSAKDRTADQTADLRWELAERFGEASVRGEIQKLRRLQNELERARQFPATMIMKEMEQPRQAYVLQRGEYDKPLKNRPVQPGLPAAIGTLPPTLPQNRLGLAQWLVGPDQPLTARVTVNRFWQRLFGVGLVKTSEDFGAQGDYPSHPDLLDWLAVEFAKDWDVKRILKTIVMSNTYRQSSRVTHESFARDPDNRLMSRGPRSRLDGEAIRDNALAVSGLLDRRVGGPSVYPYHPDGLWLEINNRPGYSRPYPHQTDSAQHHRRTLYTFWKRTVPPPSIATFDAPSREYCVVRRSSTNTPLQAFVMLHDPQFVEAARHLAGRMIKRGGDQIESRIAFGFQSCTSRLPREKELAVLMNEYRHQLEHFASDREARERLLAVGVLPRDKTLDPVELAAMTQVARMLMNLSEFLTKG